MRGLTLELMVCPEIASGRATDRRELAALAQASVSSELGTVSVFAGVGPCRRPVTALGSSRERNRPPGTAMVLHEQR
ncbi:hypothetical protein [Saccharomonospora sp.]|uniref:hypothetical protein n=1 Tax=Saccharomonospora sp. TaxID=33913 RepID=UPI00262C7A10|nr:hypothetical protein [Saccharomonospora sp.]